MDKRLILFCGISGSGKSTRAKHWAETDNYIYINADSMRGVLSEDGNESDQSQNGKVFQILEIMVKYFMKQGLDIIIDNLNNKISARGLWIRLGKRYGYKIEAFVMNNNLKDCISRDSKRERKVGAEIITNQLQKWIEPTKEEGFDLIDFEYNY